MTNEPPDKIRLIICLLAVVFVFTFNVSIAKAPEPPEISDFIVIQGNTVRGNTPLFSPKWQVLGTLYWQGDIGDLLEQYDWDLREAKYIMFCESSSNPTKINWKDKHNGCIGSFGLFQLACFRGTQEELLNPATNIKLAYELWKKNGWKKDWLNCSSNI